jgi:hypothetical protein
MSAGLQLVPSAKADWQVVDHAVSARYPAEAPKLDARSGVVEAVNL